MKIKNYVEDLKTKSAAELQEELVAAKKGTLQFEISECNQSIGQYKQNQRGSQKYCQNSDTDCPEQGKSSRVIREA